jgi:hypothetical protein
MKLRFTYIRKFKVGSLFSAGLIVVFLLNAYTFSSNDSVNARERSTSQVVSGFFFDKGRKEYYREVYTFTDLFTLVDKVYVRDDKTDSTVEITSLSISVDLACAIEKEVGRCVELAQNDLLEAHSTYASAISDCAGRASSDSYLCMLKAAAVFAESPMGCGCTLSGGDN